MASLRYLGKVSNKLLANNTPIINIVRSVKKRETFEEYLEYIKPAPYRKYMPNKRPETREEWEKAAARYGMHPDEYKPFPLDTEDYGDYPYVPRISYDAKCDYYPWDYPTQKRNYGDVIHPDFEFLGGEFYEYGVREPIGVLEGSAMFLGTMAFFFSLYYIAPDTSTPVMEKQYPKNGTHYTFEPAK